MAEDAEASFRRIPLTKEKKKVTVIHYELVIKKPYKYTSGDILFPVVADKKTT